MTNQWVVLSSSARMPSSCKGNYRNVALVKLTIDFAEAGKRPAILTERADGCIRIIHLGRYHVGGTRRGAFQRAVADAEVRADRLNAGLEED